MVLGLVICGGLLLSWRAWVVVCKVVGQGPRVFWRVQESLLYNNKGVKALWGNIADVVVESDDDVGKGLPNGKWWFCFSGV